MASSSSTLQIPESSALPDLSSASHAAYDVFISHRGLDVKKTFASHLYRGLLSHGLRVLFLDTPELQEGYGLSPQIRQAIKTASVHVAIFSPHYAQSSRCLEELQLILHSEAPIVAVFYHVSPAESKRRYDSDTIQTWRDALCCAAGISGFELENEKTAESRRRYDSDTIQTWRDALSRVANKSGFELENKKTAESRRRYDSDTIQTWRDALSRVADISGFELENKKTAESRRRYDSDTIQTWRDALSRAADISGFNLDGYNGDEAKLVEKVIEYVLKTVQKSAPINNRPLPSRHEADEQRVSLSSNEAIEDFENRISWQRQTEKPHIVGIVGFAGVGKTTLAKELFDRRKVDFKKYLFLSAHKDSLHSLQLKICKALINQDIQEDSIKGIESFKENLRALLVLSDEGSITDGIRLFQENLQVLLVLDDIDHVDQLVALLPVQNYLSSKSRILIISRKKKVLRRYGIERSSIYKLTRLRNSHSTELFSSKAFGQRHPVPPEEFEYVVKEFVKKCHGSPWLLAMYGALLCGKNDISDWKDQLKYLQDLELFRRLQAWDRDQLHRLPRHLEKLKGLSRRARDLIKMVLLQQQNGKVQVAGITGSDGVGKTFLARELFEMKTYDKSCMLYDVSSSSLHSLLKKLLEGLIQKDFQVDSVDEGIDLLKGHVSSFPSLVILDNADHWDPMHAFLSVLTTVLPSTSLILITSRDKEVLKLSGVKEPSIYELNGLEDLQRQDTLELFCTHAFGQPSPLPEFEDLANGFLIACNGLPLTLRLFGALFYGKIDRTYWQDQLDRLQQMDPTDIQKILKIIYDGLTVQEQEIFLHIACSCIGEKRALALRLSDRRGSGGLLEFESLQRKCLVEVNSEDCIIMHEQLRDLGRTIAHQKRFLRPLCPPTENNPDLLQQSSNEQVVTELWRNIDDLLQQSPVIREVRGFMVMILIMMLSIITIMMMSMMTWTVVLTIILVMMITAIIIWSMPKRS